MRPIRELIGRELEWVQPRIMHREYELKNGEETVATLVFRSSFGSFATVETADGSWTFKRVGFWQPRVTVCVAGSEQEIATFKNSTWTAGGTLELPDGHSLKASTNFWMSKYAFMNEAEEPYVKFENIGGVLHRSAKVEVLPAAAGLRELPWLVAFAWYLVIKMHDDAGGAGAAAAAAG